MPPATSLNPTKPPTKTPLWAWVTIGSLVGLLLMLGALFLLLLAGISVIATEDDALKAEQTTTQPDNTRQRIELAASADGKATLIYTNIKGEETEVEFEDTIVVEALFSNHAAGASVYSTDGGKVICQFLEPEGVKILNTQDTGKDGSMNYYMCFAALLDE